MMGARHIAHDPAAIVLAGATEASLTPLILSGFRNMGVLALRNARAPEKSFAPFDAARSGFVAAEGSAVLVLESRASAEKRGAKIYCELAGSAALSDSTHLIRLDPTGETIARLIERASTDAQIPLEAIDYLNLHGTATKENDIIETRAVKIAWGRERRMPALSATKPITGHLLGASGAIEAVISVLALTHQFVPPTLNLNKPDPECDLDYTPHVGRKKSLRAAMSLSYGFGGHLGALVFRA
jgi:3-oxoacyl-[acyl-carrier-protein] synthase II